MPIPSERGERAQTGGGFVLWYGRTSQQAYQRVWNSLQEEEFLAAERARQRRVEWEEVEKRIAKKQQQLEDWSRSEKGGWKFVKVSEHRHLSLLRHTLIHG
jgi:hypothetical protein